MIRDMIRARIRAFLGINEVALTAEKAQSMSEFVLQALDKTDDRLDLLISRVDPLVEFPEAINTGCSNYAIWFHPEGTGSIWLQGHSGEPHWSWSCKGDQGSEETPQAALKALLQAAEPRQPLKILG